MSTTHCARLLVFLELMALHYSVDKEFSFDDGVNRIAANNWISLTDMWCHLASRLLILDCFHDGCDVSDERDSFTAKAIKSCLFLRNEIKRRKRKEKKIPFFLVYKTRVFDRRVVTLKAHLSGVSVDLRSYVAGNFWETNKESRRFWLIANRHINQLESTSTKLLWLWSNESLIFSTRRRVHLLFLSSGNDCSLILIEFSWLWANNHDSFVSHMARINKIRL